MKINKKALAILAGLTVGMSSTAFAATADSFTDVPKDHWSYQALDYLVKEGVIDGMGDNTFQGGRTMTRYEMASIVAKAMQKGGGTFGDQAVLDKLAAEYSGEIDTLKKQVNKNTKDINDLKNGIAGKMTLDGFIRVQYDYDKNRDADPGESPYTKDRNRFYMNLNGSYKVNDNWKAKFQLEKNSMYNNGHPATGEAGLEQVTTADGKKVVARKSWSGHDGNIQRIWVEGYNPHSGGWISIGRAWRGLGGQNVLFGTESDGVQFGVPIRGTHLTASGFWFAETAEGNPDSWYGVGTWGNVGHSSGINLAFAKKNKGKDAANTWRPESYGYVLSGWVDVAKNLTFKTDYVKTNADWQNTSWALRLNYRNTDLQKPGTYQLYTRYLKYGWNGTIAGDDEWGSTPLGNLGSSTKGWMFGLKYVPWKNVEWETIYAPLTMKWDTKDEYKRTLVRTQMDFHF